MQRKAKPEPARHVPSHSRQADVIPSAGQNKGGATETATPTPTPGS
jgi:hypothetical protein